MLQEHFSESTNCSQRLKPWSRIVARAWADQAFRIRLLLDPKTVLREHGVELDRDEQCFVSDTRREMQHEQASA
jgi:hypothetical protein